MDWVKLQNKEFSVAETEAKRIDAILNATRGLYPECVQACIEAVKTYREFGYKDARDMLNDASELLPKEEP